MRALNAADTEVVSVALFAIITLVLGVFGLIILRDWRGIGSRYYRLTTRLPFSGFYRDWGFGAFRILVGGGALMVSCVSFTIIAVFVIRGA